MAYILTKPRFEYKKGTVVYDYNGYDYGLSNDDTYDSGIDHISVTVDPKGSTPFFTVPVTSLLAT